MSVGLAANRSGTPERKVLDTWSTNAIECGEFLSRSQLRGGLQQGCPSIPFASGVQPNTSRTGATGDGIRVQCDRTIPRQGSTFHLCASSHCDGGQCQDASLKDRVCSKSR